VADTFSLCVRLMDVLYAESRNEPSGEQNKMKPKEIPLLASVL